MTYNARDYARLRNGMLSISLLAWVIILLQSDPSSCCAPDASVLSVEMLLTTIPVLPTAMDWGLMLIAMMAPTLVPALYDIRISSFAARRARSMALFAVGYGAIWIGAGIFIVAVDLAAAWSAPESYLPPIIVGGVALAWQASPLKQRCLNRAHRHRALAAFGVAADHDALRMGLDHGLWCAGSCWAAMLFPMLLPKDTSSRWWL